MFIRLHLCSEKSVYILLYLSVLYVTLSTDVCTRMLRLVVCHSSQILMLKNTFLLSSLFFFFGYGSLMAALPGISATDSQYKLDVYINKFYDAARCLF